MKYSLCVNEIFDSIDGEGKKGRSAGHIHPPLRLQPALFLL